jgi:hypothetical protein
MEQPRNPSTVDDRRRDERRRSSAPMRVTILRPSFEGCSDNLSEAGVFFTSQERLAVEVEIEEGGVRHVRRGHLVRVQRMSPESTGYAIEFDR